MTRIEEELEQALHEAELLEVSSQDEIAFLKSNIEFLELQVRLYRRELAHSLVTQGDK